jgi:hypothetical protein
MPLLIRFAVAVVLLCIAAFCVFGIVATYEPIQNPTPWRIGYGLAIAACLCGVVWIVGQKPPG